MKLGANDKSIGFVLFLFQFWCCAVIGAAVIPSNSEALLQFSKLMNNLPTNVFGTWVVTNDCSSWPGVACDAHGFVISLRLQHLGLAGTISPYIGNLTHITTLDLSYNLITGPIPDSIGGLTLLTTINLSSNRLSGGIPAAIGLLSSLQTLILNSNSLQGSIALDYSGLLALQTLGLEINYFSGPVPPAIGSLVNLKYLTLASNSFTGSIPATFGSLSKLVSLNLGSNKLTGSLPSTLLTLTNLQNLQLNNNLLSGRLINFGLPPNPGLPNLQYFDLSGNQLSGPLIKFYGLKSLVIFNVNNNKLSGEIDPSIGKSPYLKQFLLYSNLLSGSIPAALATCLSLQRIDLHQNLFYGPLPTELANLPNLVYLRVHQNQLSGPFPSNFLSNSLTELNLRLNYFTGVPNLYIQEKPICNVKGVSVTISNNCFDFSSSLTCNFNQAQRDTGSCVSFCNATAPTGACGGFGSCYLRSNGFPTCSCISGYNNAVQATSCSKTYPNYRGTRSTGLLPTSLPPKKGSFIFRYASAGYNSVIGSWAIQSSLDWSALGAVNKPKDQKTCDSCWAFAPIAALESARYLTFNGSKLVSLSEQQVIDCTQVASCAGGWPGDALEYAASEAIVSEANLPYRAINQSISCSPNQVFPKGIVKISQYEVVNFRGWFGLLLAVQQSPVIVNIEADQTSFVNYAKGQYTNDVYDDPFCFFNGVDHSVVIIGYNIENIDRPYWIIRNSWGASWGLGGYMRLKITGNVGICGINSLPGLIPIIPGKSACNKGSWGSVQKTVAGRLNPCGGGTCVLSGSTNKCTSCPQGWVPVTNLDQSQTCAPANPCTFFSFNPCGVGSCVNNGNNGLYTCVCPFGYGNGFLSTDNSSTCITATELTGLQYFTVPAGFSIQCSLIYETYGISKSKFLSQNKMLSCSHPLSQGVVVNITKPDLAGCAVPYAISAYDTCTSIAAKFKLASVSGPGSLNPDLDCLNLQPGQQICIQRGSVPAVPLCTDTYDVNPGDTCNSIVSTYFGGSWLQFYSINLGIYCDLFSAQETTLIPYQTVCLAATKVGAVDYITNCRLRKGYFLPLPAKAKCATFVAKYYKGSMNNFKIFNNQHVCTDSVLSKLAPKTCMCVQAYVAPAQRCLP